MTKAVCFNCGEIKFGAFLACNFCSVAPVSDDDLVLSLAITDHYFSLESMGDIGKSIKEGVVPNLGYSTRKYLLKNLHKFIRTDSFEENKKTKK